MQMVWSGPRPHAYGDGTVGPWPENCQLPFGPGVMGPCGHAQGGFFPNVAEYANWQEGVLVPGDHLYSGFPSELPWQMLPVGGEFLKLQDSQAHVQLEANQQSALQEEATTTHSGPKDKGKGFLRRKPRQRAVATPNRMEQLPRHAQESALEEVMSTNAEEINAEAEAAKEKEMAGSLLQQLSAGGRAKEFAITKFKEFAFASKLSSRAAQRALAEAPAKDASDLVSGLQGHVREAMRSMYANYVVQKIVEVMPSGGSTFVAKELRGFGADAARHRFGCRVLCRLLEHGSANESSTAELFEEILIDAEDLCKHSFGSFVMGHFLEFGHPEHQHKVVNALRGDTHNSAADKRGSHIVEAALQYAGPEDRHIVACDLLASEGKLMNLAYDQFGCHVVKSLLRMPDYRQRGIAILLPAATQLRASKYGRHVVAAMEATTS